MSNLAAPAASSLQMPIEEVDDPTPSVARRRLVKAGCGELRDHLDPERELRRVVIVEKAVPRVGVDLDVVVDARGGEHRLEAIGNLTKPRPRSFAP